MLRFLPMIKITNVCRRFISGKSFLDALTNINLEIEENDFIALVGPSGSGKSTLLNLIGGLDQPTKGSIFIRNKDIGLYNDKELSKYRNSTIGFVFQEFHLEPFLSVKKNILLPTQFGTHEKNIEEKASKLIQEVGLSKKSDTKVHELSGGQKQRTAIARALINSPQIILADEPTGNLDEKTGETIINLLKKAHKEHNTTLIIATHDAKIAKSANKIIQIKDGKIW
jgi:putative ABC transport system ATP-binding protein